MATMSVLSPEAIKVLNEELASSVKARDALVGNPGEFAKDIAGNSKKLVALDRQIEGLKARIPEAEVNGLAADLDEIKAFIMSKANLKARFSNPSTKNITIKSDVGGPTVSTNSFPGRGAGTTRNTDKTIKASWGKTTYVKVGMLERTIKLRPGETDAQWRARAESMGVKFYDASNPYVAPEA